MKFQNNIFSILTVMNMLFILLIIFLKFSFSTTYYLDPAQGNDSNTGKEDNPWKTFYKVKRSVRAGDTVNIMGGTYTRSQYQGTPGEPLWTQDDRLGERNKPIIIQSKPGERAIFNGENAYYFMLLMGNMTYPGHYLIFNDLEFKHYRSVAIGIGLPDHPVKYASIINCNMHDFYDGTTGNAFTINSEFIIIKNNTITNMGQPEFGFNGNGDHAQYTAEGSKHVVVESNRIENIAGYGIHGWGHYKYNLPIQNWIVRRNTIINTRNSGLIVSGTNYYNIYIYNNTFYNKEHPYKKIDQTNSDSNITFRLSSKKIFNANIKNNIGYGFYDIANIDIPKPSKMINFYLNYNLWKNTKNNKKIYLWNGRYYDIESFSKKTGYESNSIVDNPLFKNISEGNFHLERHSKARDKGIFLSKTVGAGNGRVVKVVDAGYFIDGFGMLEGDTIHIGTSIPVRITSVDYNNNIITINKKISWKSNQGIYLPYSGSNPDLGAYEYIE